MFVRLPELQYVPPALFPITEGPREPAGATLRRTTEKAQDPQGRQDAQERPDSWGSMQGHGANSKALSSTLERCPLDYSVFQI